MPDLPAPLVPPEVDLRDFPYLPLDIARLFGSEFHARSSDTVWRAGVTLWLKAFHQVPAASIPDDDVAMARLAELGRDLKTWAKIKADVLRGWVKCSDGRWHHPVVAEKALEAWIERLMQRKASAAGNAKRYKLAFDAAPFDKAVSDSLARLAALNPNSRILTKRVPRGQGKADAGTPEDLPSGADPSPGGSPDPSHRELDEVPSGAENPPTGIPREAKRSEAKGVSSLRSDGAPAASDPTPKREPTAQAGGTRIPPGWTPDLVDREYAARQGLTDGDVEREAEKFRDYWLAKAGPNARKIDWRAVWRTWCRTAAEDLPKSTPMLLPINGGAVIGGSGDATRGRPTSGSRSAMAGILAVSSRR